MFRTYVTLAKNMNKTHESILHLLADPFLKIHPVRASLVPLVKLKLHISTLNYYIHYVTNVLITLLITLQ